MDRKTGLWRFGIRDQVDCGNVTTCNSSKEKIPDQNK